GPLRGPPRPTTARITTPAGRRRAAGRLRAGDKQRPTCRAWPWCPDPHPRPLVGDGAAGAGPRRRRWWYAAGTGLGIHPSGPRSGIGLGAVPGGSPDQPLGHPRRRVLVRTPARVARRGGQPRGSSWIATAAGIPSRLATTV